MYYIVCICCIIWHAIYTQYLALYTIHYIYHTYIMHIPLTTYYTLYYILYTGKSLAKVVLGPTLHEQLVLHSTHYEQNKRRWDISKIKADSSKSKGGGNEYGVTVVPIRRLLSHTTTNNVISTTVDATYTITNITATYTYYMPTDNDFYNTEYMSNLLQQVHSATLSITTTTTTNNTHMHSALSHIYNFSMPIYNNEERDASILESVSSLETYESQRLIDHNNRRLIDHDSTRLIDTTSNSGSIEIMPRLEHNFALTQSLRCTGKNAVDASIAWRKGGEWMGQNYDLFIYVLMDALLLSCIYYMLYIV